MIKKDSGGMKGGMKWMGMNKGPLKAPLVL
jgi:hypothetical protein